MSEQLGRGWLGCGDDPQPKFGRPRGAAHGHDYVHALDLRSTRKARRSACSQRGAASAGTPAAAAKPGSGAVTDCGCGVSPRSNGRQVIPAPAPTGYLGLVEFAERSDDALPWSAGRAHRLAQMPIAVTDPTGLFVFPPQEHLGSIAETRPFFYEALNQAAARRREAGVVSNP